jgi:hypothetical protein
MLADGYEQLLYNIHIADVLIPRRQLEQHLLGELGAYPAPKGSA